MEQKRFEFGTKAETLNRLRPLISLSVIEPQFHFSVGDWYENEEGILNQIKSIFGANRLIVRSSSIYEDGMIRSNAGKYSSQMDVPADELPKVSEAITLVINSYDDEYRKHQVLIQKLRTDIALSGVVFTRSLDQGAPYYVLNYDEKTSNTTSVTNGHGRELKTSFIYRAHLEKAMSKKSNIVPVIRAVREIEELVGRNDLDIEFGVDYLGQVYIFQVRPLTGTKKIPDAGLERKINTTLNNCIQFLNHQNRPKPLLYGARTCYGVMPDWNPAEVIGIKPRNLALSLYRYLITDNIWARQRADYGYRDVRPHPLVVSFAGHPYVDVRVSFNSFLPATLPARLATALVEYYMFQLKQHPELHDKIEFDVAFTSLAFDFSARAEKHLRRAGFFDEDIAALHAALHGITLSAIKRLDSDIANVLILEKRVEEIINAKLDPLERVFLLLEACKQYGTLPFAHVARAAFIAVSFLESAVKLKIIDIKEKESFFSSLNTVTRCFESDSIKVAKGKISMREFISLYGHLRPGTYEITLPSYATEPEKYFVTNYQDVVKKPPVDNRFSWSEDGSKKIQTALSDLGLQIDLKTFEKFLRNSIEGREELKFKFTKALSLALDGLSEFGEINGIDIEQLSHISIQDFLHIHNRQNLTAKDKTEYLLEAAEQGLQSYELSQLIELPALIFDTDDFYEFERFRSEPNFISRSQITADSFVLKSDYDVADLSGKIILIPQADPGYDWLFQIDIAGLITMYGGANSHMAIRAAERRLPAAIGVGQQLYNELSGARTIYLNCLARKVEPL